jgi:MFS family permease
MNEARTQRFRSLMGVIAAMAVVNLVYGISFPLLALVLDGQGVSKTLIGLSTISQAVAIFAIAPLAPRLMARLQAARIMQLSGISLAVLFLLAGWWQNVYFWFPLRFVIGALTALLWICSEALINELSVERWRSRVVGIYTSVGAAGFALGPLLLIATGSEGLLPFLATAGLVLLSAVPLFLVEHASPGGADERPVGLWVVIRLAPVVMLINVAYGAAAESMITFFPLFGMHFGLSEAFSLFLMTIVGVGGMVLILPMGWLADHVDRMGMLFVCVALSMLGLLAMPWVVQGPTWLAVGFLFAFGGVEGMIYALGVALVGQQFRGAALAAATTAFTTSWGVGTIIGPMAAGVGMDAWGAGSLTWIAAFFFALFLPLPMISWWRAKIRR